MRCFTVLLLGLLWSAVKRQWHRKVNTEIDSMLHGIGKFDLCGNFTPKNQYMTSITCKATRNIHYIYFLKSRLFPSALHVVTLHISFIIEFVLKGKLNGTQYKRFDIEVVRYLRGGREIEWVKLIVNQKLSPAFASWLYYQSIRWSHKQLMDARINRESYMSAHVLLNLLNELRKKIKYRVCRSQRV